jgi:hypothetical protein
MMLRRLAWLLAAGLALTVTGCTNALYFYETGKISLTVEGRPDSTQPVQGSLGYKQRTAVVAPGRVDSTTGGRTDSGSMISSFRFGTKDKISIRTALITGQAARCLSDPEAQQAARAVADVAPIPAYVDLAKASIDRAREQGKLPRLIELTQKPFSALTDGEKADLGTISGVGEIYNAELHSAIADELGS